MPRAGAGTTLFLWLMLLAGGVSLFACVFLPPWLELRALRQERDSNRAIVQQLEQRLARATKQIEHMQSDPAYIERLAHEEFGIDPPGVEVIPVETRETTTSPATDDATDDTPAAELAAELERATETSPLVSVFVLDQTRPIVMAMSGVVVVVAVVLLVRARGG
jgi:hypothetical protein